MQLWTNAVIVFRDGSAVLGPLLGNDGYVGTNVATVEHSFMSSLAEVQIGDPLSVRLPVCFIGLLAKQI